MGHATEMEIGQQVKIGLRDHQKLGFSVIERRQIHWIFAVERIGLVCQCLRLPKEEEHLQDRASHANFQNPFWMSL